MMRRFSIKRMVYKIGIFFTFIIMTFSILQSFSVPAYAEEETGNCSGKLLGFIPSWHENICKKIGTDNFELNDIIVIGFNILDILLSIMTLAAVVYFVVGTVKLIGSSGKPDSIAMASKTMVNALLGLVLGLSAGSIAAFMSRTASDVVDPGGGGTVKAIVEIIVEIGAAIAIIMVVKAAIQYTTSGGDSGKVAGAKNTLTFVAIGLVLMVSSYTILALVVGSL